MTRYVAGNKPERDPYFIISHDVFNQHSGTVIALAMTSHQPTAGYPLTYALPDGTLSKPSWVKISQIRTLSVQRLSNRAGSVDPEDLADIIDGLNEMIAD